MAASQGYEPIFFWMLTIGSSLNHVELALTLQQKDPSIDV